MFSVAAPLSIIDQFSIDFGRLINQVITMNMWSHYSFFYINASTSMLD